MDAIYPQPDLTVVDDLAGPYDPVYGRCACHGAPVNSWGRCEPINDTPSHGQMLTPPDTDPSVLAGPTSP